MQHELHNRGAPSRAIRDRRRLATKSFSNHDAESMLCAMCEESSGICDVVRRVGPIPGETGPDDVKDVVPNFRAVEVELVILARTYEERGAADWNCLFSLDGEVSAEEPAGACPDVNEVAVRWPGPWLGARARVQPLRSSPI